MAHRRFATVIVSFLIFWVASRGQAYWLPRAKRLVQNNLGWTVFSPAWQLMFAGAKLKLRPLPTVAATQLSAPPDYFPTRTALEVLYHVESKSSDLVVVLPGIFHGLQSDSQILRFLTDHLASLGFNVLALPNMCAAEMVAKHPVYPCGSLEREASLVVELVRGFRRRFGLQKKTTHFLGYSYGGFLTAVISSSEHARAIVRPDSKFLLLSPPLNLKASVQRIDSLIQDWRQSWSVNAWWPSRVLGRVFAQDVDRLRQGLQATYLKYARDPRYGDWYGEVFADLRTPSLWQLATRLHQDGPMFFDSQKANLSTWLGTPEQISILLTRDDLLVELDDDPALRQLPEFDRLVQVLQAGSHLAYLRHDWLVETIGHCFSKN